LWKVVFIGESVSDVDIRLLTIETRLLDKLDIHVRSATANRAAVRPLTEKSCFDGGSCNEKID
ncbi:MAG: hypothetical protein LM549_16730, partial [Candidatus Competibacter sp.]|nr:hypothetical protein [Candidatus Competibacter sp.]